MKNEKLIAELLSELKRLDYNSWCIATDGSEEITVDGLRESIAYLKADV